VIRRLFVILLLLGLGAVFAALVVGFTPDDTLNLTARYYAEHTAREIGAANIVTAIVVTYRGLDTLGEVTVLFLTATIVGLVLAHGRRRGEGRQREAPPTGELLTTGTRLLVPLILLLGVYVFVNGHLTPGGGFQGGVILASAFFLAVLARPARALSHDVMSLIEGVAGAAFILIGLWALAAGGEFLQPQLGKGVLGQLFSAGTLPLLYLAVGLKVGAELAGLLADIADTEASEP
jgi:multicomponent Na+:H+ antiporter subunit B